MTSTIKVNNVQNQCGQNIINENSNTITIGASGDTIALASGASQTGFGRTGTVDWQTTIKTGDFTAVSGEGYFINTTSGTITMTLPSSPSAGDIVALKDYANTFDTNKLTIARNGQPISGSTTDAQISVEGQSLTLVYGDATKGWQSVAAATETDLPKPEFIVATGGTITTVCTNFKVHTFTGPGTFTVCSVGNAAGSNTVDYLVIAGGGAGGNNHAGGGGAGGTRFSDGTASGCYTAGPSPLGASALPVSATGFPIVVGAGGAGSTGITSRSSAGANSSFSTITSTGGGPGGNRENNAAPSVIPGLPGGSGGGVAGACNPGTIGNGNTPPVTPPQGNNGGTAGHPVGTGGGGGGATAVGTPHPGGCGGVGLTSSINGTPTGRGGGGGGGNSSAPLPAGNATQGGGTGAPSSAQCCSATGTVNTGGGGGGGGGNDKNGKGGGSGIVIIRYRFQ
jgi:hypothetical protein